MSAVFDVENVPRKLSGSLKVKLTRLRFDCSVAHFSPTDEISFVASLRAMQDVAHVQFSVTIFNREGFPIGNSCGSDQFSFRKDESRQVKIVLPTLSLASGRYHCRVALGQGNEAGAWKNFDAVADTLNFEVVSRPFAASGSNAWKSGWGSIIFPKLEAEVVEENAPTVFAG
jgi:hypothetical protein